ncbi:MAG: homoserine O-acetyltransferase [Nitrospinota bacterium]|nr:homoserine O-acetyltransferase [Nitrospinota bacterium]
MNKQNEKQSQEFVETEYVNFEEPFETSSGHTLEKLQVAYEAYGNLNENKDNAILVIHALTGDAHAAGFNSKEDERPGWWDPMIGPGKALDTRKYYIICTNNLGGCSGTTGPTSINPSSGKPYGMNFPVVTVEDTVRLQMKTMQSLGVKGLKTVIGGSLAGMQTLEWGIRYSDFCESIIPVAAAAYLNPMGIAWNKIGRHAIMTDQNWNNGDYDESKNPFKGLMTARMIAHITYLSNRIMWEKFGRRAKENENLLEDVTARYEVERYLDYQGEKFSNRFDANSYIYLSRMMDLYDMKSNAPSLKDALETLNTNCCLISFISDWLFPTECSTEIAETMQEINKKVELHTVESTYGHDAFLVQYDKLTHIVHNFLNRIELKKEIGIHGFDIPSETRRFVLTFPSTQVSLPVLWELGKNFKLEVNIIRGEVNTNSGWQVCEFKGDDEEIKSVVNYLRSRGIWVDEGGYGKIDHDRAEVV